MNINLLIEKLNKLKQKHGKNIDVTVWQYGGGLYDLCTVDPHYSDDTGTIVLKTEIHNSRQHK